MADGPSGFLPLTEATQRCGLSYGRLYKWWKRGLVRGQRVSRERRPFPFPLPKTRGDAEQVGCIPAGRRGMMAASAEGGRLAHS